MARILQDIDVAYIRKLRADIDRLQNGNPPTEEQTHVYQASHTYIARTPTGGIPALDSEWTGTTTDDAPGYATCGIWKIDRSDDLLEPYVGSSAEIDKTVWNVSEMPIDGDIWIVITKTKNGRWVIVTPQQPFDRCNATMVGSSAGTGTPTVDNVVVTRGKNPVESSGDTLEVTDLFDWDWDDNAPCKIEYNYTNERWELYQVKCQA